MKFHAAGEDPVLACRSLLELLKLGSCSKESIFKSEYERKNMQSEYFLGRNGKLLNQVTDLSTIRPEVTLDLGRTEFKPVSVPMYPSDVVGKKSFIAKQYQAWGRFGINGDLIKIDPIPVLNLKKIGWKIDFIGRLDRPRPILAVDVLPIIYTANEAYCVLIKRGFDPGKDELALIGGHQEVRGFEFQTPAAAIKMELEEEAGLKIEPPEYHADLFYHRPMAEFLEVEVMLNKDVKARGHLILIGTFETSVQERLPHLGRKRVDWTTAYLMPIYVGENSFIFHPKMLDKWFKAGDDAKMLVYIDVSDYLREKKKLAFGISHHRMIFHRAIEMFRSGMKCS